MLTMSAPSRRVEDIRARFASRRFRQGLRAYLSRRPHFVEQEAHAIKEEPPAPGAVTMHICKLSEHSCGDAAPLHVHSGAMRLQQGSEPSVALRAPTAMPLLPSSTAFVTLQPSAASGSSVALALPTPALVKSELREATSQPVLIGSTSSLVTAPVATVKGEPQTTADKGGADSVISPLFTTTSAPMKSETAEAAPAPPEEVKPDGRMDALPAPLPPDATMSVPADQAPRLKGAVKRPRVKRSTEERARNLDNLLAAWGEQ